MIHGQNTSQATKHVGSYNDKRCVVVIQLPEQPTMVDIIDTESLPDIYHQNLMEIVNSPEGQNAQWVGEVMSRRMLFDGSNALRAFYQNGFIQKVPSELVTLFPRPNQPIPFMQAHPPVGSPTVYDPIAAVQNPTGLQEQQYADLAAQEQVKLNAHMHGLEAPDAGHNQHAQNLQGDISAENHQIGMNLLAEAQMLEAEANSKRAMAAQHGAVEQTAPRMSITPPTTPTVESLPTTQLPPNIQVTEGFMDPVTGKNYKTAGALKGAITRREKAANG